MASEMTYHMVKESDVKNEYYTHLFGEEPEVVLGSIDTDLHPSLIVVYQ